MKAVRIWGGEVADNTDPQGGPGDIPRVHQASFWQVAF